MPRLISRKLEEFNNFLEFYDDLEIKIGFFGGRHFVYDKKTYCLNDVVLTLNHFQKYLCGNQILDIITSIKIIDKNLDRAQKEEFIKYPLKRIFSVITRILGNLFFKRNSVIEKIKDNMLFDYLNDEE